MTGAITRGLSLTDLEKMTVGQLVDFCITYNESMKPKDEKKKEETKIRRATQKDFDRF